MDEPIVRKYSPPVSEEKQQDCIKPPPPCRARGVTNSQQHLPRHQAPHGHHHCNCENDSQKSATCSSTSNETDHTSGYQTDDGTFEGKMLRMATRSKPANIRMTALKDYNPCCEEELVLRKGQRVKVLYKNNDWVYAVTKNGEAGYVPYNYVRPSRKYAGYQSEPEYVGDTDYYQSGYETDMPYNGPRRYGGGAKTQIGDVIPTYSIHTGFRESPESYVPQNRHVSRLNSGGSNSPPAGPPRSAPRFTSGYTSAVEYPVSTDTRRHPRPAKSLHSIAQVDRRPSVGKPAVDTFTQQFLEELVVIHDFEAREEDEVFISKGERVKVYNAEDPFWLWVETAAGMQGFVPRSCCSLGNHPRKSKGGILAGIMHLITKAKNNCVWFGGGQGAVSFCSQRSEICCNWCDFHLPVCLPSRQVDSTTTDCFGPVCFYAYLSSH